LFDFSIAVKLGYRSKIVPRGAILEHKKRNDVKGVVLTVHEILTRDPSYKGSQLHYLDEPADLLAGPEKWAKHPDVELEPGVDATDYYDELIRWVAARRERPITCYTEASEFLDWPMEMRKPPDGSNSHSRDQAREHKLPYIEWVRPLSVHLDRSRRLLATGKYADEAEGSGVAGNKDVAEPKPKDTTEKETSPPPTDVRAETDAVETTAGAMFDPKDKLREQLPEPARNPVQENSKRANDGGKGGGRDAFVSKKRSRSLSSLVSSCPPAKKARGSESTPREAVWRSSRLRVRGQGRRVSVP